MRFSRLVTLLILLALLPGVQAQPNAFPDRPIRLLVGWTAGGGTDVVARLVAARLADFVNWREALVAAKVKLD